MAENVMSTRASRNYLCYFATCQPQVYRVEVDTLESVPDAVNESDKSPMAAAVADFLEWSAPKRPPITSTSSTSRTEVYVVKIFSELAKIRQSPEVCV